MTAIKIINLNFKDHKIQEENVPAEKAQVTVVIVLALTQQTAE